MFRQAKWNEPIVYEISRDSKEGVLLDEEFRDYALRFLSKLPKHIIRDSLNIPSLSEVEVVRHFTRLSQMSYGVDLGPVPLGSCTMKYNPKICEELASDRRIVEAHPYLDEEDVQGLLEILYTLQKWLAEIVGMDVCSLQTPAGAAGELAGALMIKKYHRDLGEGHRDEMIVPDSAHGSNPASAAMAGFKVVRIPTDPRGNTDIEALRAALSKRTAGVMLTNPNTLGLFEEYIVDIAREVHGIGGLLYYDGANLNGILGYARPGDMGFDVAHLNLHKTFAAPHGGGGPGAGAICAKGALADYLPVPLVEYDGRKYYFKYDVPRTIGRISWFYGNIIPAIKSFLYIATLGPLVKEVAEVANLNTNYMLKKLSALPGVDLVYGYGRWRKHEFVISFEKLYKETGVGAEDVAKALLDRGFHAPTILFPLIVPEAHMIEVTETESRENIDNLINAYKEIINIAYTNPSEIKRSPQNTSVKRLDTVYGNLPKNIALTYRSLKGKTA
ncbi:MAG: aminomethyl-transferring glycine dehydrogenase subunit GcvPB [Sulfolobales archaeon]